jgi:hypothetical protein
MDTVIMVVHTHSLCILERCLGSGIKVTFFWKQGGNNYLYLKGRSKQFMTFSLAGRFPLFSVTMAFCLEPVEDFLIPLVAELSDNGRFLP